MRVPFLFHPPAPQAGASTIHHQIAATTGFPHKLKKTSQIDSQEIYITICREMYPKLYPKKMIPPKIPPKNFNGNFSILRILLESDFGNRTITE